MSTTQATVETLTAEVRVLTVGNRQITQSVAKQLDQVPFERIEPFGRVKMTSSDFSGDWCIGRSPDGELVTSKLTVPRFTRVWKGYLPLGAWFQIDGTHTGGIQFPEIEFEGRAWPFDFLGGIVHRNNFSTHDVRYSHDRDELLRIIRPLAEKDWGLRKAVIKALSELPLIVLAGLR